MIQMSFAGLNFSPRRFRRHVYLRDQSIEVMRNMLQSRYLRSNVAHKQLARTSLSLCTVVMQNKCFVHFNHNI